MKSAGCEVPAARAPKRSPGGEFEPPRVGPRGFATIPAYLKDIFGVDYVGAIHGRLLTAWAAAGVFGPVLVNYIRQYQVDHGVAKANAYTVTVYIMAALLFVGFLCNYFMTPVDRRHHLNEQGDLKPQELARARRRNVSWQPQPEPAPRRMVKQ